MLHGAPPSPFNSAIHQRMRCWRPAQGWITPAAMVAAQLDVTHQFIDTADGWSLHLRRTVARDKLNKDAQPLLIVPGYGMNSFIFSFHPRGTSMERWLAEAGHEVWAMDLRGQGESTAGSSAGPITMDNYACIDIDAAVTKVLERTATRATALTLIGVSLGGSLTYGYLALNRDAPVKQLVTMGAPLTWVEAHPLMRTAFFFPALAGALRMSNTRGLVRKALPFLRKTPGLLGLYMNTATIDMDRMDEMTKTVEDPDARLNREIALWLKRRTLHIRNCDVAAQLAQVKLPLYLILANRDGIVPPATTRSASAAWGGDNVEELMVGNETNWFAHANLFIANDSPQQVFDPLIDWVARQNG